ncbi:RNA polymerase sigma-70 factor [Pedobacter sp.]
MDTPNAITIMQFPICMGQHESFDLVYRTYHQALVYYAKKFVDAEDASDLVENIFVRLWEKRTTLNDEEHIRKLLYLSVRNACLNHIERKNNTNKRHRVVADQTLIDVESHLHTMMHAEVLAEVYRAINQLPLQCARVITLSYVDGKSNGEIAEEMGLSEQTVKNHKTRGLKILKDNLSDSALILLLMLAHLK